MLQPLHADQALQTAASAVLFATWKKDVHAAAPTGEGHVLKQPRYEVRPQALPLIDEDKRHLLYLDRHHACIVMTSVISRIDRMESVFHRPSGYHIRVHLVLPLEIADVLSLAVPLVQIDFQSYSTATEAFQSSQIPSKIRFPLRCCRKDSQ
jgi:hypothetical protein